MGSGEEVLGAPLAEVPLPPAAELPLRTKAQDVLLVFSISLMMIVSVMNNMSIVIALPVLGRDIGIANSDLQWPVTAYALAFGCLLLLLGRLADIFGRKPMFMVGAFIFATFNIACGASQNLVQLSVFRAMTGVGAAAAIPAGAGIIANTFPPTSRTRAIAFTCFSAGAPIGSGLGSTFGGIFTQWATWRGVFYFTAGLSYIPMMLGYWTISHVKLDPARDKRVDWLGGLLSAAGLTLFTFGLGAGPTAPDKWATPYVIASLVLGLILIFSFLLWEHLLVKLRYFTLRPLMPLDIWTRGRIGANFAVIFFGWVCFQAFLYHTTLYFQEYEKRSPIMTTVRFLPTAIAGFLINVIFALLVPVVYGWVLIAVGCASGAVAAILMACVIPADPYWQWAFPAVTLSVFLADFLFATTQIHVASVALPDEQSLASALMQVMLQLGVALGLAITTVVNDSVASKDSIAQGIIPDAGHTNIPSSSYLLGLRAAQWTSAGAGILALVLTIAFLQPIKVLGHKRTKRERQMEAELEREDGALSDDVEDKPSSVGTLQATDLEEKEGIQDEPRKSGHRGV